METLSTPLLLDRMGGAVSGRDVRSQFKVFVVGLDGAGKTAKDWTKIEYGLT